MGNINRLGDIEGDNMQKKNIEGSGRNDFIRMIILFLVSIIFIGMVFLFFFTLKHYETLSTDALQYGAKQYNIDSCTCYSDGDMINFGSNISTNIKLGDITWDNPMS